MDRMDERNILLRNIRLHPDLREIRDHEQVFRCLNDLTTCQLAPDDPTAERRHNRNDRTDLPAPIKPVKFFLVHAEQLEPVMRFVGLCLSTEQFRLPTLCLGLADHLLLQEELRPIEGLLRNMELGLGLEIRRLRQPQLAAVQDRQRRVRFHFLPEVSVHFDHSATDQGGDLRHVPLIRLHDRWKVSVCPEVTADNRLNHHPHP